MRVLVIGLGNRMYGDDGYGDVLAEALESCGARGFDVLRGGHAGLGLLGYLSEYDVVVFIDVVGPELGGEPGSVTVLEMDPARVSGEECAELLSREVDPHAISPVHLVALLYATGVFRGKAYLIGVVPRSLEFGKPLSQTVFEATPKVLDVLRRILTRLGLTEFSWDEDCVLSHLERICSESTASPGT